MNTQTLPFFLFFVIIPTFLGLLGFTYTNYTEKDDYRIKTVVIDAGHGGKDPGSRGAHAKEKDVALAVSLKLGKLIELNYPDINIIYTRTIDTFVALDARAKLANENNADVFISIHCNAVRQNKASVKGVETFVLGIDGEISDVAKRENEVIYLEDEFEKTYGMDPGTPEGMIKFGMYQDASLVQSILLASHVQREVKEYAGRKARHVKQDKFVVLRLTNMPSVMVELGFISNTEEEAFLMSEDGQQQMATSLHRAFKGYKEEIEVVGE